MALPGAVLHTAVLSDCSVLRWRCAVAAVLCLERDAEASRREAGATHFESGVARAVESHATVKQTGLYCLKWLVALLAPLIVYAIIVGATG